MTRSPLRTDSAVRLASSPKAVTLIQRVTLSPCAGGDLDRESELDAGGAVAGGEGAGVIAEAAGDGDVDRVHGGLPECWLREGRPLWVAAWAAVPFPAVRCQRRAPARSAQAGRSRGGKMFSSGVPRVREKICGRHRASAARGRVARPGAKAQADKPREGNTCWSGPSPNGRPTALSSAGAHHEFRDHRNRTSEATDPRFGAGEQCGRRREPISKAALPLPADLSVPRYRSRVCWRPVRDGRAWRDRPGSRQAGDLEGGLAADPV